MKGLVLFLLVIIVIGSLSFVVMSMDNLDLKNTKPKLENKITEFSTFTSAVCENKDKVVNCKDEVFVKCNGTISKAVDAAECNGIKINVPKATGFATFSKDWKDPRV